MKGDERSIIGLKKKLGKKVSINNETVYWYKRQIKEIILFSKQWKLLGKKNNLAHITVAICQIIFYVQKQNPNIFVEKKAK